MGTTYEAVTGIISEAFPPIKVDVDTLSYERKDDNTISIDLCKRGCHDNIDNINDGIPIVEAIEGASKVGLEVAEETEKSSVETDVKSNEAAKDLPKDKEDGETICEKNESFSTSFYEKEVSDVESCVGK